jgi:cyclic lactone autoinducer peptide
MFKWAKISLLTRVACMATFVAMTGVSARCMWLLYEPEVPEALKDGLK